MAAINLALQVTSALFAIAAAVLWLVASGVETPVKLTKIVLNHDGTFEGEISELFVAVRKQSRLNAWAAGMACVAAALQGVGLLISALAAAA